MNPLTPFENSLKYLCGALFAPLGIFSVRQNYRMVLSRFGKIDRVAEPGLRWAPPFRICRSVFMGAMTHTLKDLHILDENGTPIIVTAILQYRISDPVLFIVNSNSKIDILERISQANIRSACSKLSYDTLRKDTQELTSQIRSSIESAITTYGVTIDTINIIEVNFAPEIAQQMLMKQQAKAYLEARKEIVDGAIGVAKDTIKRLPDLSKDAQEKIVCNLLTTLTSSSSPQPVVQLR